MAEVAHIYQRYGAACVDRFGANLLPSHRRAIEDLARCRTAALGGHVLACSACGTVEYVYHSCLNRSCPKCHAARMTRWLETQERRLLPVPHFHFVFTLPQALREIVRRHQRTLVPILFRAAANALLRLAKDPRYVGATLAILAVLHTWGRTLVYHPHIHCLVSAGGLDEDGTWRPARRGFLVPVRALSILFRARFMAMARKALPQLTWPSGLFKHSWVVHAKPSLSGPQPVLRYLGLYVGRVAISNERIVAIRDGRVTFRYRDTRDGRAKSMTLPADEFMRRFLQHVLPRGQHKVRGYGLFSPPYRAHLLRLQAELTPTPAQAEPASSHGSSEPKTTPPDPPPSPVCVACGGILVVIHCPPLRPRSHP